MNSEVREQRLRLLSSHRRMDDHIIALVPVDGSRDTVFVSQLKGVQYSDDFLLYRAFLVPLNTRWEIKQLTKLRPVEAG
jgi:hypothetical protein